MAVFDTFTWTSWAFYGTVFSLPLMKCLSSIYITIVLLPRSSIYWNNYFNCCLAFRVNPCRIHGIYLSLLASLLVLISHMNVNYTVLPCNTQWQMMSYASLFSSFLSLLIFFFPSVSFSAWCSDAGRRQRWPTHVVEQSTWPLHTSTQRTPATLSWAAVAALTTWRQARKWSGRDGSQRWSWPKLKPSAWWTISRVRAADASSYLYGKFKPHGALFIV